MIAREVMMVSPVVLHPEATVAQAMVDAAQSELDVLPVVDGQGQFIGAVAKAALIDSASRNCRVADLCCADALLCAPEEPVEHLRHDASSSVPHQTIVVVDRSGRFHGVIPSVHWAVDEAKVQSGHPRSPLEVRTSQMHLVWRCLECGAQETRNVGLPERCPHCGAPASEFALHTED
ncbi:MAG: CBS domain-containing protein [Alicyclobacillus sp.]|nr:CBS domain-containing protein [Alicyclobacillus sp.]